MLEDWNPFSAFFKSLWLKAKIRAIQKFIYIPKSVLDNRKEWQKALEVHQLKQIAERFEGFEEIVGDKVYG